MLTILLHFYRRNYPAFANAAKVKEFIHYYQAKAAAVSRTAAVFYCWHLGCILPRVPAIIVRTGCRCRRF